MSGGVVRRVTGGVTLALGLTLVAAGHAGAVTVRSFTTGLSAAPMPTSIVGGADGNVWFTDGSAVGRISTDGTITEFTTGLEAQDTESSITLGSDGDLWFCEDSNGMGTPAVGRIDPSTGVITNFPVTSNPDTAVLGPDGNVWYLGGDGMTPAVGHVSPAGQVTEVPLGANSSPEAIAPGPDGNMWVLDDGSTYRIDQVVISHTPATVNAYSTGLDPTAVLDDLTAGPDHNVWFTADGYYGRITPTGAITEIPQGTDGLQTNGDPDEIILGPDGNLWFDDQYSGNYEVGSIDPTTLAATEYELTSQTTPQTIAFGNDANLWVVQTGLVARVTSSGVVSDFATASPTSGSDGDALIAGPDGNLWFNDLGTPPAIIKIGLDQLPVVNSGPATAVTTSSAMVAGSVTPLSSDTTVSFQYGTNPHALTASTPPTTLMASTQPSAVTAELTGLTAGATVYYRVLATNGAGASNGAVLSFTVAAATAMTTTPTPAPTPTTPASATTTASVRFGDQTLTLTTPAGKSCVASAIGLKVHFTSKVTSTQRPSLTFQSASFFIDRGLTRRVRKTITVRHRRRRVTVTVDVANQITRHSAVSLVLKRPGLGSGEHTLRVVAAYRVTVTIHGHRQRRIEYTTLTARFHVC